MGPPPSRAFASSKAPAPAPEGVAAAVTITPKGPQAKGVPFPIMIDTIKNIVQRKLLCTGEFNNGPDNTTRITVIPNKFDGYTIEIGGYNYSLWINGMGKSRNNSYRRFNIR